MKLETRREQILAWLAEAGFVGLDDLAARFAVSKMTIHRDLDDLEAAGLLRKLRGGASIEASAQFEADYRYRALRHVEVKRQIARAAADRVETGMRVMLNDGSTAALLAEEIALRGLGVTIITNNHAAIHVLQEAASVTLITLGGRYSRKFHCATGPMVQAEIAMMRADLAFISSPAIDARACYHMDEGVRAIKAAMIAAAARPILMAEGAKFGRDALYHLADLDVFSALVTYDLPQAHRAVWADLNLPFIETKEI